MIIFRKHTFTYFLDSLFDTHDFSQEIKGRFFLNLQKNSKVGQGTIDSLFQNNTNVLKICNNMTYKENIQA